MIEYFIRRHGGHLARRSAAATEEFRAKQAMGFRRKPAGVVVGPLGEGSLEPPGRLRTRRRGGGRPVQVHRDQSLHAGPHPARPPLRRLRSPDHGDRRRPRRAGRRICPVPASRSTRPTSRAIRRTARSPPAAINRVLDAVDGERAVHFCFGNYGGQTIQGGTWKALVDFLNSLHTDHLVLELAHRPDERPRTPSRISMRTSPSGSG